MNHQDFFPENQAPINKILSSEDLMIINLKKSYSQKCKFKDRINFSTNCMYNDCTQQLFIRTTEVKYVNKLIKAIRNFLAIKKFYQNLFINKLYNEVTNSSEIIQKNFRIYFLRITFKRKLILKKFVKIISKYITIIQKYVRRHLIKIKMKHVIQNLNTRYFLIYGDYNRIIKKMFSRLRLVKYDQVRGIDIIKHYDFNYIKEFNHQILLIPKSELKEENTYVNFSADNEIINNYNFPTFYKNNKFYNILNTRSISNREYINYSLYSINFFYDTSNDINLYKNKSDSLHFSSYLVSKFPRYEKISKKMNSTTKISEIKKLNPILKSPSNNIFNSSRSNNKRVSFKIN